MQKISVFNHVTVDGLFAGPNGEIYNGPKNSDTKVGQNKVVKCHHAKTLF